MDGEPEPVGPDRWRGLLWFGVPLLLGAALCIALAATAGPTAGGGAPSGSEPGLQQRWDVWTAFGEYMPRTHCMVTASGEPDWPWIFALVVLSVMVVGAYLKIYRMWRRCYRAEQLEDRNHQLMQLAHIFVWCAVCGYFFSVLMFFWPAYRLLAAALVVLNVWSWRFAFNSREFQASFRAKRLQRELAETLQSRNAELERQVADRTRELQQLNERLREQAERDPLTKLANRSVAHRRIERALARRRTEGVGFAAFFLDFDRFKLVNDSLGHQAGDQLLRQVAGRLESALVEWCGQHRSEATAARLGGDEFMVLIPGVEGQGEAVGLAEGLLDRLTGVYRLDQGEVRSTPSIGVVTHEAGHAEPEGLVRDGDVAMYAAKDAGRGTYAVFDQRMRDELSRRLALEAELRRALDRGELFVRYEPLISLSSGEAVGFEALARWHHPERGELAAGEFVPVAEDTGLIHELGEWVLRAAAEQMAAWRREGRIGEQLELHVNLSSVQFEHPQLPERIDQAIAAAGWPAERLHLEITETAVMRDPEGASAAIDRLRALGVRVDMDDFGTGHSSLACLHRFPLDTLKIDQSFVAGMAERRDSLAVVQTIVELARNLGMRVVAEGVETADHVVQLQALDAEVAQGRAFGWPAVAEEALALLQQPPANALPDARAAEQPASEGGGRAGRRPVGPPARAAPFGPA